ncbi:HEAT repeat domain-containing protein [Myxococcota bacterium]|nr:HEAT repeat domain-containing protein [Myxococcota bacterium]
MGDKTENAENSPPPELANAPAPPSDAPSQKSESEVPKGLTLGGLEKLAKSLGIDEEFSEDTAEDHQENSAPPELTYETSESDAQIAPLIEVYFEMEEPIERDTLFDEIIQTDSPLVTKFLETMLSVDEDDVVQASAAAVLAERGHAQALERLREDLRDPGDEFFFTNAVTGLSAAIGPTFYDELKEIWQMPERDSDQRQEAMLGMEILDPPRAMIDFTAYLDSITDIDTMADDEVELVMMVFVRNEYTKAIISIENLAKRVSASSLDLDEKTELVHFLLEGSELLRD